MIPQIIYLVLLAVGLLLAAYRHNEPKDGVNNFWVDFIATTLSFGLFLWGGFFHVWGWN